MANCARCGQALKDGARFCGACGAAVRFCGKCGALLKDGAAFCGQCGAAANETAPASETGASPPAPIPYPAAMQAAPAPGWVRFDVRKPIYGGMMNALARITNTILVDGIELRTVPLGEKADCEIPVGVHAIQVAHTYSTVTTLGIPITRTSDPLQLTVAPGTLPVVVAVYNFFTWKFDLHLE